MRIYINNLNLTILTKIQNSLNDLLIKMETYIELYTNESIYQIDNKRIYILEPKDGEISVYKNYFNDITLVVDNSYFKKSIENSVYGNEHLHKKIKRNIYKLNAKSKICFVIELAENLDNLFVPNDVYFECDELIDIKEIFIKQELIEFLSLLN
jgi:hypothetical protein